VPWQLTVSWSEIDAYRQCAMKHRLAYIERWQAPEDKERRALGTHWHTVQQKWRSIIRDTEIDMVPKTMMAWLDAWLPTVPDDNHRELLRWMFAGYLEKYGLDEAWETKALEYSGTVELPGPDGLPIRDTEGRSVTVLLKTKIDLVAIDHAGIKPRLIVVDYKASSRAVSEKALERLDQFGLYAWLLLQSGRPVWGAIHDHALTRRNKKKPQPLDDRFHRTPDAKGEAELQQIAADAYATIRRAWHPVTSTWQGPQPARPERSPDEERCAWKCDFPMPCFAARRETGDPLDSYMASFGFKRGTYTGLRWIDE